MDPFTQAQIHVDEKDINGEQRRLKLVSEEPTAKIRDSSRSRLQRLGALYANPHDLSSPIHRTEEQFCADSPIKDVFENSEKRVKQRYGKLAELACSINQWEDDVSHHDPRPVSAVPPPKPALPSRKVSGIPPKKPALPSRNTLGKTLTKVKVPTQLALVSSEGADKQSIDDTEQINATNTKQLTCELQVMNSLEAQGLERRESSILKPAYVYTEVDEKHAMEEPVNELKVDENKPQVVNLASRFSKAVEEKSTAAIPLKTINVKAGLVSGRAAAFEQKTSSTQQLYRPQKDPTELSLKERMQLFERKKGGALLPKAALGMAPSISKIRQGEAALGKELGTKVATAALACNNVSSSSLLPTKPNGDNKLREKVAALVASTSTMAESKLNTDIQKQRQEDVQVRAYRFNKQKEVCDENEEQSVQSETLQTQSNVVSSTKHITSVPRHPHTPPPPPPKPKIILDGTKKRHSPSDILDDDESKRSRKSVTAASLRNQMYPALSDLESESERDNDCTTATIHGHSVAEEHTRMLAVTAETDRPESDFVEQHQQQQHSNIDDESYMDTEETDGSSIDICNGNLDRVIKQVVQKNHRQQQQNQQSKPVKEVRNADKKEFYGCTDSSVYSSEASGGVDDFLDEALEEYGDDDSTTKESADDLSRESKATTSCNSFFFCKTPKKYTSYQTISEENDESASSSKAATCNSQPVKPVLSVNRGNDDNTVTLVHTISFYRRQQGDNSAGSTPVRTVSHERKVLRSEIASAACEAMQIDYSKQQKLHEQNITHNETYVVDGNPSEETESEDSYLVQEKIKKLLDEVGKQQTIIAQASQALNLCAATIEFSGSTESVEGERHLLVATHRREAYLAEVQRLRVEKCLRPLGALRDKGRLTVKEITIPLREDYIRKLAGDTIAGHHLVCLLKCDENVLATKTMPTLPGLLAVKFPDILQMDNVHADFKITLEIYGMTAQREVLPHEVKYHINRNKKSGIKTPKKKGSENHLVMPLVQSPAGPNAVRTPALVQYGCITFSLHEIHRTSWTLTQVLGVSPLEGTLHMKANCQLAFLVEHRGFLTMFEEISGFGAWHRRWCYLNGSILNYWKYPDDENRKAPIGSLDLYACRTRRVTIAPRDICARRNTMLLEFVRPVKETDVESLIIVPNDRNTIVRQLLSADTQEECVLWCAYFNKVLLLLQSSAKKA
ncbi:anillin-like [Anastrepha obliqua]|uniref:anillin-like n=1 Tax=Anastrepha obliqua TaxID=95512 RepID=UPI002409B1C0|nr:anillin-like [Anastrepha obliqua]